MLLLDTNILIDYLRGKQQTVDFIHYFEKIHFAVSTIVVLELYNGCLNRAELAKTKSLLNGLIHLELNETISQTALNIGQAFALSHRLSVSDTLIAATALVYDLELRTHNLRDFRMIPGLRLSNSLQ